MNNLFYRNQAFLVYGILFVLMMIGSIADYPVSKAMSHSPDIVMLALDAYGEVPKTLSVIALSSMLICGRKWDNKGLVLSISS